MEYWFRAKRLSDNQWEYGGVDDKNSSIINHHQFIPIDPDTLGLHTGEHDVHYCGIFHGDILKVVEAEEKCLIVVVWSKYGWTYEVHPDSEIKYLPDDFNMRQCKVIGNIWDGTNNVR